MDVSDHTMPIIGEVLSHESSRYRHRRNFRHRARPPPLALKASGCTVYEFSRRAQGVEGLHHIAADVTSEDSVRGAVAQVMDAEGRIDILVKTQASASPAPSSLPPPPMPSPSSTSTFFGMVNMNRAVIPIMRQAGRGRIVNLSSVAAPVPIPFQAYYSATKASVNAYAMALANESRPFGITVCAVMPGDIHTGFTAARRKVSEGDDIYGGRISPLGRAHGARRADRHGSPRRALIAKVALGERSHHPLYAIRADYKFFVFLSKILPAQALNRLIYAIYAK